MSLLKLLPAAVLLLATGTQAAQLTDAVEPEPATTGQAGNSLVRAKHWMVVAANPLATRAGADILSQGGNAIDAMVTVQLMLGLVEPQSSGIGGGAFMLYWDQHKQQLSSWDGRETAPSDITPELFLDEHGLPLKFYDAVVGGRSVGVPGTVRLLWQTHQKYGRLPWKKLIQPVIEQARNGFEISPRLAQLIAGDQERLSRYPGTRAYFMDLNGHPKKAGTRLYNKEYARTLKRIARKGDKGFYYGRTARDITRTVQQAEGNPGKLSLADMASYEAKQRPAVCSDYQQYQICGMGPPSSGGMTVGQIMGMLQHFDLRTWGPGDPRSWQVLADASRLAFADRGQYMADQDYVPVPVAGLMDPHYLHQRAEQIVPGQALAAAEPGQPAWDHAANDYAPDESIELPSTSHFSIVDEDGNVVSMTSSIENAFGSRLMVDGFLLNNELTDFSFRSHRDGRAIVNRVEPDKRPRSSMAPTLVMKQGMPYLAIGSPGGSRIIGYVAEALVADLTWDMDLQKAVRLGHVLQREGPVELEKGTWAEQLVQPLQRMGYRVSVGDMNSGLHAIRITPEGLEGAADPRREGLAAGG